MKRYKRFIATDYDWSNEDCQEQAFEQAYIVDEESPDGEWVKWDDVRELEQSLAELLDVARSLVEADEDDYYSDYRMVAKDARKVIAKFEGTK